LNFHSDLMVSFAGENVGRPLLAGRAGASYLGRRRPAVSASCVDHGFLQLKMRFRFRAGGAGADSLVSEKLRAKM
jgi:hypothetical protein